MSDKKIHQVIQEIYNAGLNPEKLPRAVEEIAKLFNGECASILIIDQEKSIHSSSISWNIEDDWIREYNNEFTEWNPRAINSLKNPYSNVLFDYQHITDSEIDKDPFYDYISKKGDFRYHVGKVMPIGGRYLPIITVQRSKKQGHVDKQEIEVFDVVSNHLRNAITLGRQSGLNSITEKVAWNLFERCPFAIFSVSANCRVVSRNIKADQILAAGKPLRLVDGELQSHNGRETAAIRREVYRATEISKGRPTAVSRNLIVERPGDEPNLLVSISPYLEDEPSTISHDVSAVVFVRDPKILQFNPNEISKLFGLTPTESALVALLAEGCSLSDYAALNKTSISTSRWHLQNVFEKTGTHSQASLVALIYQYLSLLSEEPRQELREE